MRTSFAINAINKYPDLEPDEAIAKYRELAAKGGKANKGKPRPWAHFKVNPEAARKAQAKSVRVRRQRKNKEQ